jgi:hypothetical protein
MTRKGTVIAWQVVPLVISIGAGFNYFALWRLSFSERFDSIEVKKMTRYWKWTLLIGSNYGLAVGSLP